MCQLNVRGCLAALLLTAAGAAPLAGQAARATPDWRAGNTVGVGYTGSLPRALLGGWAYVITPALGGIGVIGQLRTTHRSHEGDEQFIPGMTVQQAIDFNDRFVRTVEHWRVANIGVIRPVTAELALYGGAGLGHGRMYDEYYDETSQRGEFGFYRVLNDAESGGRLNLTTGAVFRAGRRVAFQFGLETAPRGMTAGASLLLPR